MLRFCDNDVRDAMWTGPEAEAEAWAAWNRHAPGYNCYVFRLVALSQPPEASEVEAWDERETDLLAQLSGLDQEAIILRDLIKRAMLLIPEGKSKWWDDAKCALTLRVHPPKASPMQELQKLGQEFDANVEASALRVTGEMLKAALLEEGGDAYMRNEDTPSHFLIDGIVDLDAVANALAQPAPEQGEG